MKAFELRKKSKEELAEMLKDLRREADQVRFEISQKKTKNVKKLYGLKKDVARILTALNAK
ncbi:MAG: 50S ribosomal protein L29 [Candidatus Sungbacteria bacterium]|nr:50S ribosomal protein L29 [Candidatus Sungbacteria bacterium]